MSLSPYDIDKDTSLDEIAEDFAHFIFRAVGFEIDDEIPLGRLREVGFAQINNEGNFQRRKST
jgi:hypothetical protein